jgi:hypothetical protein
VASGGGPVGQLGGHEAVAIIGNQCLHHRMLGRMGLHQGAAGPVLAAGAARHLVEQLEGALGRAQVAAIQTQVGIDHGDQGEVGK